MFPFVGRSKPRFVVMIIVATKVGLHGLPSVDKKVVLNGQGWIASTVGPHMLGLEKGLKLGAPQIDLQDHLSLDVRFGWIRLVTPLNSE